MYAYNATLYCDKCGRDIIDELGKVGTPDDGDTDTFPQYADEDHSETDCPSHCDECGELIHEALTDDGREYVLSRILDGRGDPIVLNEWASTFGIHAPQEHDSLIVCDWETDEDIGTVPGDAVPRSFVDQHWTGDGWASGGFDGEQFPGDMFGFPGRTVYVVD